MAAVVGVLNESLTESIKGFYKLRKAYTTLDGILAAEARYVQSRTGLGTNTPAHRSADSLRSNRSARSLEGMPGGFQPTPPKKQSTSRPTSRHETTFSSSNGRAKNNETSENDLNKSPKEEDEFFDASEEAKDHEVPATYTGHLEIDGVYTDMAKISLGDESRPKSADLPPPVPMPIRHGLLDHDPDSDVFANPIDIFIHSGANLCFGLLLVMISMIPPAFSRLLFIIGFHGDKQRGMRMLWQASKFHNINGALAGLIVLGYYNTLVGFSDIIPETDPNADKEDAIDGYPKERCEALLVDMRSRHPKSHLWLLEEARMQAANRNLSSALGLLENSSKSPLKQVEALEMFETSLNAMYSHKYALCSDSFTKCVSLNNWSHALYYYIAGAAQVELYRQHKTTDPAAAQVFAQKASELLRQAPQHAGKKKFMARQLPFDVFVTRKLRKWEARAQDWSVSLVDAVGVSPLEEMIFFWNGYKRMDEEQLNDSLTLLSSSISSLQHQDHSQPDETAVHAILVAATLRNLHRYDDAEQILRKDILKPYNADKSVFKGGLKDDWPAPAAHYEMAALFWMRRAQAASSGKGIDEQERLVRDCEDWVERAAKWEAYELDARIGLKITTAQDTLKRWREKNGL